MTATDTSATGTSVTDPEAGRGTDHAPFPVGDFIFAVAGIIAGIVIAITATGIRTPDQTISSVDARAFPFGVAALLTVASLAVVVNILRGKRGASEEGEDVDAEASTDWLTVGVLTILFIVFGALIMPIGWPFAVTVLFGGTAWRLGAKRWWVAILVGLAMGLVTQYLFGALLGISLPPGPLLEWIPIFNG